MKPVKTSLAAQFKFSTNQAPRHEEEESFMRKIPYANLVSSIMYAMVCTRPDFAHSVSLVSRFMSNSGKEHGYALKWVTRYVAGTLEQGLEYGRRQYHSVIAGFVDADFTRCLNS